MKPKGNLSIFAISGVAILLVAGCGGGGTSVGGSTSGGGNQRVGPMEFGGSGIKSPVPASSRNTSSTGIVGDISRMFLTRDTHNLTDTSLAVSSIFGSLPKLLYARPDGSNLQEGFPDLDASSLTCFRWTPDGQRLLYARGYDSGFASQIYVANSDGTGRKALTAKSISTDIFDASPDMCPTNPNLVVFDRFDYVTSDVYVVDLSTGIETKLTTSSGTPPDIGNYAPRWSPDGTKIAYTAGATGKGEVWVMNANGSGKTKVSQPSPRASTCPIWSPDGQRLCYVTYDAANPSAPRTLETMDAVTGGGVIELTRAAGISGYPATYAPDGSKITYACSQSNGTLRMVGPGGAGDHQIADLDSIQSPSLAIGVDWSPFAPNRMSLVGGTSLFGTRISGFLYTESSSFSDTFGGVGTALSAIVAFRAVTPSTVVMKLETPAGADSPTLVYSLDMDRILSMSFCDAAAKTKTDVVGGSLSSTTLNGALVSFSAANGKVNSILTYLHTASAGVARSGSKPTIVHEGGRTIAKGGFVGVFDARGKNLAANGASEVWIDDATGAVQVAH